MQPFLNAYPKPTGPDQPSGLARAVYGISNPSTLNAASIRLDHRFTQSLSIFGRYDHSPSETGTRGSGGMALNDTTLTKLSLETVTLGATYFARPTISNEFRFNWSRSSASSAFQIDNFGGAVPFSAGSVLPTGFTANNAAFGILPDFTAQNIFLEVGRNTANRLKQVNVVDNISLQKGGHFIKTGVDFRSLTPTFAPATYLQGDFFFNMASAVADSALLAEVFSAATVRSTFRNYSAYAQDAWKINSRLTVTYGVRWDYNPTPSGRGSNGLAPYSVTGITNPSNLALAPAGTPIYHATRDNFAPRLGLAYQIHSTPGRESVLKAGVGVFYDLGNGPVGQAFGFSFPFEATKLLFSPTFPLSSNDASPPAIAATPPFQAPIWTFPATLKLPYTYQWNLSLEQALGTSQTLNVGYLGSLGRHLIRTDGFSGSALPPDFQTTNVLYSYNGGYSDYNAVQIQFKRQTAKGLDVLGSYTFSHALDNVSSDIDAQPGVFLNPRIDYSSSDFDIRHAASVALDYETPALGGSRLARRLLANWGFDPMLTARSAPVVNPFIVWDRGVGSYLLRPDLVPGVPLYLHGSTFPGAIAINPNALSVPGMMRQGDLGRNYFRGFSLVQADLSVRRSFRLTERVSLQARVEAFNLLNHPNYSPEANQMGTVPQGGTFIPRNGFGISQSVLSQGLSRGSFGSGFNPLYQIGGPRSLQLAAKLEF
jgi:hypothetical protein